MFEFGFHLFIDYCFALSWRLPLLIILIIMNNCGENIWWISLPSFQPKFGYSRHAGTLSTVYLVKYSFLTFTNAYHFMIIFIIIISLGG